MIWICNAFVFWQSGCLKPGHYNTGSTGHVLHSQTFPKLPVSCFCVTSELVSDSYFFFAICHLYLTEHQAQILTEVYRDFAILGQKG